MWVLVSIPLFSLTRSRVKAETAVAERPRASGVFIRAGEKLPPLADRNVRRHAREYARALAPRSTRGDRDGPSAVRPTHPRPQRCAPPTEFPRLATRADSSSHPTFHDDSTECRARDAEAPNRVAARNNALTGRRTNQSPPSHAVNNVKPMTSPRKARLRARIQFVSAKTVVSGMLRMTYTSPAWSGLWIGMNA